PEYVRADENKLRQILINLLGNAIKFTQSGSVTLRVNTADASIAEAVPHSGLEAALEGGLEARPEAHPEAALEASLKTLPAVFSGTTTASLEPEPSGKSLTLVFEVEDTGPGIAAEEMGDLFKSFHQTQVGRNSQEGTGLGLHISQRFAQLMGGAIRIRSEVGQGSCFTFSIRVTPVGTIPKALHLGQQVVGLAPDQPRYRVLVAEDNVANRLLLVKLLSELGLDVLEAEDGYRAIALWQEWQPHLIFMDMHMPSCNGYTATQHIRQSTHADGPRPAIIAITASAFAEQRHQCLVVGCDDFVSKPFHREELLLTLAKHLGLEYCWEPVVPALFPSPASGRSPNAISEVSLAVMPNEWLAQLHRAAAQGNDALSLKLISQIPSEQAPLMEALTRLVENYQFDQLMVLTKR
ncbi:MAG TPA: ATP-binding protein, partial [Trichocoleus sp.]